MASGTIGIRFGQLSVQTTSEDKTIATGLSSQTFSPPTGWDFTMLVSAYARTTGNIVAQGVTADSGTCRFYNNSGSSWTGSCAAYWLCGKYS